MKLLATVTAVTLIILGLLIILVGAYTAISGSLAPVSQVPSEPGMLPDLTGWFATAKMIAGGAVALQGVFMAAIGEALWLLVSISSDSEKTSLLLYGLMQKVNPPKSQ